MESKILTPAQVAEINNNCGSCSCDLCQKTIVPLIDSHRALEALIHQAQLIVKLHELTAERDMFTHLNEPILFYLKDVAPEFFNDIARRTSPTEAKT